jgi:acyl carrier protein
MPAQIKDIFPVSPQQAGMLMVAHASRRQQVQFVEQFTCRITGPLDAALFQKAWAAVIERHDSLRTCFSWAHSEVPVQVVVQNMQSAIRLFDVLAISAGDRDAFVQRQLRRLRIDGFDLSRPPLISLALFQIEQNVALLAITLSHLIADGWSLAILMRDLFDFYSSFINGKSIPVNAVQSYSRYIEWLGRYDKQKAGRFWAQHLKGYRHRQRDAALPLPLTETAPPEVRTLHLSPGQWSHVRRTCQHERITPGTLLTGLWAMGIARSRSVSDVIVGLTTSGRPSDLADISETVGLFSSTVPLRVKIKPEQGFWIWLRELQSDAANMRENQHLSIVEIMESAGFPRGINLIDNSIVVENYPVEIRKEGKMQWGDMQLVGGNTAYPLSCVTGLEEDGMSMRVMAGRSRSTEPECELIQGMQKVLTCLRDLKDANLEQVLEMFGSFGQAADGCDLNPESALAHTADDTIKDEIYKEIKAIVCDTLGLQNTPGNVRLIAMGGHSLACLEIVERIRSKFAVRLSIEDLLSRGTINTLAEDVRKAVVKHEGVSRDIYVHP